jgi:hypothetical protein
MDNSREFSDMGLCAYLLALDYELVGSRLVENQVRFRVQSRTRDIAEDAANYLSSTDDRVSANAFRRAEMQLKREIDKLIPRRSMTR